MSSPAPTLEAAIWLALEARLKTLVTDPPMSVIEPGAAIPPEVAAGGLKPFLTVSDIRGDPIREAIGPECHRREGVLQVTVCWPVARPVAHAALVNIAGRIAAHFPADLCMSSGGVRLRVIAAPAVVAPYREGAYTQAPVRISWRVT